MSINNHFALNHILSPNLILKDFFALSNNMNIQNIEIRNDLPNVSLKAMEPNMIKELSKELKIKILSINALQKFNLWNDKRRKELIFLCEFAKKCNCKGIVLVPLNNGKFINHKERQKLLYNSLKKIKSILNNYSLIGYVEPLGFKTSSLRFKSEVAEAIDQISPKNTLKILHDTFHHYLAGENKIFPKQTGLVHISGVSNNKLKTSEMLDKHRVLIDENDVLKNVDQLKNLIKKGYEGVFSFEPFAKKIQNMKNPSNKIIKSINYLKKNCSIN